MRALRTSRDYATLDAERKAMREIEVTFLGTGTSHGIPVIGCECRVCHSPDPKDKRLRTAILVRTPECTFSVDTPPDFRTQCLREGIRTLDAVVYTHSHSDHILGFDDLRRFCEVEDRFMPIYGSASTLNDLARVFKYAFDDSPKYRTYVRPLTHTIEGPFRLGETDIVPVQLPHGRTITTGLVLHRQGRKCLAYMTDCQAVPPEAEDAARGANVLVIDALRHAPHSTHLSIDEAMEVVDRIKPGRTYFIHMCHDLGHSSTEAFLPPEIRLSYDGLRIQV
jgi:phosphoribosyl 1,2-cyclic phosphate phosphodiesterase